MVEKKDSATSRSQAPHAIRSYVRRAGRATRAQARALEALWPRFGESMEALYDLDQVFVRRAPRYLEVGFGMGDATAVMAAQRPEHDFLAIDVHEPGIGRLLSLLEREGLGNVRVLCGDAMELLTHHLQSRSLDGVLVFFPDPWPKKRHHKRRLVQRPFVEQCARTLKTGGVLHMATDWTPYAEAVLELLGRVPEFENLHGAGCYAPYRADRPATRFERRGERLGHRIHDLRFVRRCD